MKVVSAVLMFILMFALGFARNYYRGAAMRSLQSEASAGQHNDSDGGYGISGFFSGGSSDKYAPAEVQANPFAE